MSPEAIEDLARWINDAADRKGVAYVAGGGTEVFPMLLARGGGSATLLSARIPYDAKDFRAVLGYDPGRFVDARAARGLAMAAFRHALTIRGNLSTSEVFGLGSTSKLSRGDGEREGRTHEIHAAIQTHQGTFSWSIELSQAHGRAWEERINALLLLKLFARGKSVPVEVSLEHEGHVLPEVACKYQGEMGEPWMGEILVGQLPWVAFLGPSTLTDDSPRWERSEDQESPKLLLPGSFRPLHAGHIAMAEAASRLTGLPCGYEISMFHPEKPPLDYIALRSRLEGFARLHCQVYLTNAPTYLDKARLFPGCTFAVGHDTALRILDPRFYDGLAGRDAMLEELEALGTRFLVFGRVDSSGEFRDFSPEKFDQSVAGFLARSATPVPAHVFRVDLSSTELRERHGVDLP